MKAEIAAKFRIPRRSMAIFNEAAVIVRPAETSAGGRLVQC